MPHAIMTACGLSLLHRAKYHRMSKHLGLGIGHHGHRLQHMKGMSAIKKDPEPEMMPAVMPRRRALKFRS